MIGAHVMFLRSVMGGTGDEAGLRPIDSGEKNAIISPVLAENIVDRGSYYTYDCAAVTFNLNFDTKRVLKCNVVRIIQKKIRIPKPEQTTIGFDNTKREKKLKKVS